MIDNIFKMIREIDFIHENDINNDLLCIICKKLVVNAFYGPCRCTYCVECLRQYLDEREKACPGEKNQCKEVLLNFDRNIECDQSMNSQIINLIVKCPYRSCEYRGPIESIQNHLTISNHQSKQFKCPYYDIGCREDRIEDGGVGDHVNSEMLSHSILMLDGLTSLTREMASLKKENIFLKGEMRTMNIYNRNYQADLHEARNKISSLENRLNEMEKANKDRGVCKTYQNNDGKFTGVGNSSYNWSSAFYGGHEETFSGLRNCSSICYLNSMIQALASSEKLMGQLNKLKILDPSPRSKIASLIKLLESINDPKSNISQNTFQLSQLIEDIKWQKRFQQDAFDVLSSLINSVHVDIRAKMISENMPLKIKIIHEVKGMDIPNMVQDHLGLSVELRGEYSRYPGVRLDYLINEHFQPTCIDDDPDKTSRMIIYGDVPEILLIHIQANKLDRVTNEMVKPEYRIIYDKELSLDLDIAIDMDGQTTRVKDVKYQLSAVIQHMGTNTFGHYVTYRNWRGKWYSVNDAYVRNAEFDKYICPYILIYEKSNDMKPVWDSSRNTRDSLS